MDHASETMWCIVSTSRWSSSPSRIRQHPQQRGARQIEGTHGLLFGARARLAEQVRRGAGRQVDALDPKRHLRRDHLDRSTVDRVEAGSQRLVTCDEVGEALFERGDVERPGHAHRGGLVVERRARLELLEEPQALLRVRQGQRALAARRHDRRPRRRGRGRFARDDGRHACEGRGLEQLTHRHRVAEFARDPRGHGHQQQRVAAQREEVGARIDLVDTQKLAPDARPSPPVTKRLRPHLSDRIRLGEVLGSGARVLGAGVLGCCGAGVPVLQGSAASAEESAPAGSIQYRCRSKG